MSRMGSSLKGILNTVRRKDFVIVTFLTALSAVLTVFFYKQILVRDSSDKYLIQKLDLGHASYRVLNQDGCVGWLDRDFKIDKENLVLTLSAYLGTRLNTINFGTTFSFEVNFGVLGQLIGAILNINNEYTQLRVGLLNGEPMQLIVRGKFGKEDIDYSTNFRGDFQLKKFAPNSFRVSSAFIDPSINKILSGISNTGGGHIFNLLGNKLPHLEPNPKSISGCAGDAQAWLNLNEITESVRQPILDLLGPIGVKILERTSDAK